MPPFFLSITYYSSSVNILVKRGWFPFIYASVCFSITVVKFPRMDFNLSNGLETELVVIALNSTFWEEQLASVLLNGTLGNFWGFDMTE